ncbi:hypothetical protein ACJIZ3_024852 [Penstemon smallii]|uniref:Replication factor A C-terminal domain-containing protein n=1 Tax=Penstemon smallii TaxID=265156 RepID=A0ABD3TT55_9LAMI
MDSAFAPSNFSFGLSYSSHFPISLLQVIYKPPIVLISVSASPTLLTFLYHFYRMTTTQYVYITDILPKGKPWTAKVVVYEKSEPRLSGSGSTRYQKIVLMDERGQKIVATVYDEDIDDLKDTLLLSHTYLVSNAKVGPLDERYNRYGYPYQWTIGGKTAIKPVIDDVIPRAAIKPTFAPISQLQKHTSQDELIDVLVIVIDKGPKRNVTGKVKDNIVRDFGVINEDKRAITLSLWNSIAESEGKLIDQASESMPVIKATALRLSSFYVLDPEIAEAQNLKNWRANNMKFIAEVVAEKKYLVHDNSLNLPSENDIMSLGDVVSTKNVEKFLVRVGVVIADYMQKFYYMACDNCSKGVDAELSYEYTCNKCHQSVKAVPRYKVLVSLFDHTDSLDVTIFGDFAKRIMKLDPVKILEMSEMGVRIDIDAINADLLGTKFLLKIKKQERVSRNAVQVQYTVITSISEDTSSCHTPLSSVGLPVDDHDKEETSDKTTARKRLFKEDLTKKKSAKNKTAAFSSPTEE